MNRRQFLTCLSTATLARAAARNPNIVLIVADDLGWGELGCQGNPQIPTPHIDSIATAGVRFTQAYVTAPFCCPSRAGLITGRYQTRFGHELNAIGRQNMEPNVGLPLQERTLANYLQNAGYTTGAFGKWHLGGAPQYHPLKRGFDEFYGFLHEGHFFVPPPYRGMNTRLRVNEPPYDDANPVMRGIEPIQEPEYLTRAITREALTFIDRNASRPFFLYLPYNAVHSPMQAPTTSVRNFNGIGDEHRQLFAGMLAELDDAVGSVLDRIRRRGIENDTLVVFISDNGGPTAELTSSNEPLRGGKGQLYEGGVRVPMLVQWKATIPSGQVLKTPVIATDLVPTALAAAAVDQPRDKPLDGIDLLPLMTRKAQPPEERRFFWRMGRNAAYRRGDWKIVRQVPRGKAKAPFELFNVADDPNETKDLANDRPDLLARLRNELDALNAQMVPPLWGRQ
jgi:arylsulfatase B